MVNPSWMHVNPAGLTPPEPGNIRPDLLVRKKILKNAFSEILQTRCWPGHPGQVKRASGRRSRQSHL
jgi:hypothetical protein